jgi:molybdopterin-guanine dinucleotide biosynthesis protein A
MLGGIVLCGGQSRRMGRSKAWLPFGPEVLLQRVVRILGEVASPIVVAAAPGQKLPELPIEVRVVLDPHSNRGPLHGFASGLRMLPIDVDLVYLTGTDAPLLQTSWVRRLVERIGDADIALPEHAGFGQPLAALYRRSTVMPAAEALIREQRGRLLDLADRVQTLRFDGSTMGDVDPGLMTLRNLNSIGDYDQAIREAGFATPVETSTALPRGSGA